MSMRDEARYGVIDDGRVARTLIQSGASPLATDDHGRTPLHEATRLGVNPKNEKTILALLEAGADINAQDEDETRLYISQP